MYAIIETGGKQYRVENGDQIAVEKLGVEDGAKVVFDKVLVVGDGAEDHPAALWNRQGGRRRTDAERSGRYAGDFPVLYIPAGKKDHETVEKGNDPI